MLITKFTPYDMTKCYRVYLKDGEIDHLQLFTSEQIRVAKCIAYQMFIYHFASQLLIYSILVNHMAL